MEELKKENKRLRKQCEIYEKQLVAIIANVPKSDGVMYKIDQGKKYIKTEKEAWEMCCKSKTCWRLAEGGEYCPFHKPSKGSKEIYYIPLSRRRKQSFSCQYAWRYKSDKHLRGDTCSRGAQYITSDGVLLCTNHVNVHKLNQAIVYRKRDKRDIPSELLELLSVTA